MEKSITNRLAHQNYLQFLQNLPEPEETNTFPFWKPKGLQDGDSFYSTPLNGLFWYLNIWYSLFVLLILQDFAQFDFYRYLLNEYQPRLKAELTTTKKRTHLRHKLIEQIEKDCEKFRMKRKECTRNVLPSN